MRLTSLGSLLCAATLVAGCAGKPATTQAPASTADEASSAPLSGNDTTGGERLTPDQALRALEQQHGLVIYFDFDNSEIRPEFLSVIAAHAKYLSEHPGRGVRLEGHADERGSREYNIGLGERRAQAVRRALMFQGSGNNQLTTISYGEERPAVEGGSEAAWAKNRRVELRYTG